MLKKNAEPFTLLLITHIILLFDIVLQCKSVIDKYEPVIWENILELMVSIKVCHFTLCTNICFIYLKHIGYS